MASVAEISYRRNSGISVIGKLLPGWRRFIPINLWKWGQQKVIWNWMIVEARSNFWTASQENKQVGAHSGYGKMMAIALSLFNRGLVLHVAAAHF